ncbi:MAG: hypothetical protein V4621_08240 [Pseudomonadota bacterium]
MTTTATAAAKTTTTTAPKAIYQISITSFRPYDGEYFTAYYATSVAGAQRLLVAAVEAEGWKMDDYEVANWNGTSTSSIHKALADSYRYSFDAGHGNSEGKPRVMVFIEAVEAPNRRGLQADRLAYAKECATALAAGTLAELNIRETRKKQTYPAKPITIQTPETMPETTTTVIPADLCAAAYATLSVHKASPYAKFNGQRLEVGQVLVDGKLALVLPGYNGNTADFGPSEYTDYTPATATAVDLKDACGGQVQTEAALAKQRAAAGQINTAIKDGKLVVLRSPADADAVVVDAQVKQTSHGSGVFLLHVKLKDTPEAYYAPFPWEAVIIEIRREYVVPVDAWRVALPVSVATMAVAFNSDQPIQAASLTEVVEAARHLLDMYDEPGHPLHDALHERGNPRQPGIKADVEGIKAWLAAYEPASQPTPELTRLN